MTRATDAVRAVLRDIRARCPRLDADEVVQQALSDCRRCKVPVAENVADYAWDIANEAEQAIAEGDRWGESEPDHADDFADAYDWREC